jgi:hypothetical protein
LFFSCVFCFFWWFFPSICFFLWFCFCFCFFLFLWFFFAKINFPCSTRGHKTRGNHGFYHHRCAQIGLSRGQSVAQGGAVQFVKA